MHPQRIKDIEEILEKIEKSRSLIRPLVTELERLLEQN